MNKEEMRAAFAGQWLAGLASGNGMNVSIVDACAVLEIKDVEKYEWKTHFPQYCAKRAVAHADALIAELEKTA